MTNASLDLDAPERPSIDGVTDRRIELDFGMRFEGRVFPSSIGVQGFDSLWGYLATCGRTVDYPNCTCRPWFIELKIASASTMSSRAWSAPNGLY